MTPTSWHQLHTWHFADHESSVMMMAACVCACRDEDDKLWSRPPSIFVHTHSTASRLHGDCPVPGAPFRKFGTFNPLLTVNKKKEGWGLVWVFAWKLQPDNQPFYSVRDQPGRKQQPAHTHAHTNTRAPKSGYNPTGVRLITAERCTLARSHGCIDARSVEMINYSPHGNHTHSDTVFCFMVWWINMIKNMMSLLDADACAVGKVWRPGKSFASVDFRSLFDDVILQ